VTELRDRILETYAVETARCEADLLAILEQMCDAGLIEVLEG
jgi:hypothetical protein